MIKTLGDILVCSWYILLILLVITIIVCTIKVLITNMIENHAIKVYLKMIRDTKKQD